MMSDKNLSLFAFKHHIQGVPRQTVIFHFALAGRNMQASGFFTYDPWIWSKVISLSSTASDVIRSVEVIEATEVFRTTQILKINNIVSRITIFGCFEKIFFLNKLMEFYWNFAISQNWGCGGQGCYFWPNPRVISKKSAIQNSQITFKPKLPCIFLPARAKWNVTVCIGTPCISYCHSNVF